MNTTDQTEPSSEAKAFGDRVAAKMFERRSGHGGGPCSYRNLRPREISAMVATAYHLGWSQGAAAVERATTPAADGLTERERTMLAELRACSDMLLGVMPHAPAILDLVTERYDRINGVLGLMNAQTN